MSIDQVIRRRRNKVAFSHSTLEYHWEVHSQIKTYSCFSAMARGIDNGETGFRIKLQKAKFSPVESIFAIK